jgi:tetratricopeptide (TPR) repeat protein
VGPARQISGFEEVPFVDNATKRQLKKQDQFVSLTERGVDWANQNRSHAAIAGVIVLAIILGIVGASSWYNHRSNAAATAFGAAMGTYETPVVSATQPAQPGQKTFATENERSAAANAQFLAVAKQYGMTTPGKMSLYFAGLTYMDEGQNTSAEDALKKTAGSWDKNLSALGKQALAQLYQQTGRDTQAVALYNELVKSNTATVPAGLAKIELAEMYQAEGKPEEAKKIYAELKDQDKDAKGKPGPAAELATEKLNPQPATPQLGQ